MGLFPVFYFYWEKDECIMAVNSSKCFALPVSVTCALPHTAVLLFSLWADFMQTSTYLSCGDNTMWGEGCAKLFVTSVSVALSFCYLTRSLSWLHVGEYTWGERPSELGKKIVQRWMCIFLLLLFLSASMKTRLETSLCISQKLCHLSWAGLPSTVVMGVEQSRKVRMDGWCHLHAV